MEQEVVERAPAMERVLQQAQQISQNSGDNRTATYATQLNTRYQALADNVKVSQSCDHSRKLKPHINGLVQDRSNFSALAMELLQSCAKPSICWHEFENT